MKSSEKKERSLENIARIKKLSASVLLKLFIIGKEICQITSKYALRLLGLLK